MPSSYARVILLLVAIISCVWISLHTYTRIVHIRVHTRVSVYTINGIFFSLLCLRYFMWYFLFKIMHSFLLWLADSCLLFFLFTQITFSIYLYISIYMYIHIYLCIYRFVYICVKLCRQRCRQLAAVSWLALKNLVSPSFKK